MKALIKFFLICVLLSAAGLMLTQFIVQLIAGLDSFSDFMSIISRLVIPIGIASMVLAIIFTTILYFRLRGLGIENIQSEHLKAARSQTFQTDMKVEEVAERLARARYKFEKLSENQFAIKSFNLLGWTLTQIECQNQGNSLEIKVLSKPLLPTILVDFGESIRMVQGVEKALS